MECFVIFVMAWCWFNATESKPQNVMRYSKPTMRKTCVILITLIMFNGCNSKKSKENWDEKNTRNVAVEDTTYLNAISLAKQNIPVFIDSLENQRSNNYDFYIKSKYSDGKNTEHL